MQDLLVFEKKDQPMTDSLKVADGFKKRHADVLRAIKEITDTNSGVSEEFGQRNFAQSYYVNEQNKRQPKTIMTYDGFMLLVMGFTGKRAMEEKEKYISEFSLMRSFISQLTAAKIDYHEVTEAIKLTVDEPHNYTFSNEFNLIDIVVLGMTAKKFKQVNGIPAEEKSIRPFLTPEQLDGISRVQKFDANLIIMDSIYDDRKRALSEYWSRIQKMRQPVRLMA